MSLLRRLPVLAIVALVLAAAAWVLLDRGFVRFVYPSWREYPVRGVDVSHHNGRVDWPRIRASGYAFAYLKASEGATFRDSTFLRNRGEASRAGLATGAYHFFTLCRPGREQARNFLDAVGPPPAVSLPPAVDLEFGGNCGERPSRDAVLAELAGFLAVLDSAGHPPAVLYVTKEFHRAYLAGRPVRNPLWVRSVFGRPRFGGAWTFWQYAATGRVAGAKGRIDLNAFRGSPAELRALVGARPRGWAR
ncbi:MAG: GH25 family lysozyme [Longimicrobiaceae bacterium]